MIEKLKSVGQTVDVRLVAKRKPSDVLDDEYLSLISISSRQTRWASSASLNGQARRQEMRSRVRLRTELDALPERIRRRRVIAGEQMSRAKKAEVMPLGCRIEPNGLL